MDGACMHGVRHQHSTDSVKEEAKAQHKYKRRQEQTVPDRSRHSLITVTIWKLYTTFCHRGAWLDSGAQVNHWFTWLSGNSYRESQKVTL